MTEYATICCDAVDDCPNTAKASACKHSLDGHADLCWWDNNLLHVYCIECYLRMGEPNARFLVTPICLAHVEALGLKTEIGDAAPGRVETAVSERGRQWAQEMYERYGATK